MTIRKIFLLLVFVLSGCGDNADPVDTSDSPEELSMFSVETDNSTINQLLPAIRARLPGLDKYASQLQKVSVEQNYWLTIKFHVPDDAKIPNDYMTFGHNCFIEINKEGTAVKIPKTPCKALMLDQNADNIDSEQWFDLSIARNRDASNTPDETREILPATPDNKPPKPGCLEIYHPDKDSKWNCPVS
ncbi:hypothetical protein [Morganella morganii]|uniref:hypothetical protein n=1 Tax=Morganella morganii TaxID=582 RepID=UPI00066245D8|nr:hypothetical protein [Morganella morganii]